MMHACTACSGASYIYLKQKGTIGLVLVNVCLVVEERIKEPKIIEGISAEEWESQNYYHSILFAMQVT